MHRVCRKVHGSADTQGQRTEDTKCYCCPQMLGENVAGTVLELGKQIRQQASKPLPAGDAEGSVFVDILGTKMVSAPSATMQAE